MKKSILLLLFLIVLAFSAPVFQSETHAATGCGPACMMQMQSFCPSCNNWGYDPRMMMPWGVPTPWWWQSGPLQYQNFYYPGSWTSGGGSWGITPHAYPGNGGAFMAKPNLYVEGPSGTEIKIKIQFSEPESNWLAAIPIHGKEGWKGTILERSKVKTSHGVYDYLYSDYRVSEANLQDQAGFCTARDSLIQKMAVLLNQSQFGPKEIADFIEYWSVKIPPGKNFCVYPQDEKTLQQIARLEITPKPTAIKRLIFMIQAEEALNTNGTKFSSAPKEVWIPSPLRIPASTSKALVIREWGVGFFAAQPKAKK